MRIVSNKASYETMSSVAEKLMEISIKKYRTGILISGSWLRYSIRSSTSRIKIGRRVRSIGLRGIGL